MALSYHIQWFLYDATRPIVGRFSLNFASYALAHGYGAYLIARLNPEEDYLDIPCCMSYDFQSRSLAERNLTYSMTRLLLTEIKSKRTVSTCLKCINELPIGRIAEIVTSKGERYYGAKGLILDHNREPLLMGVVRYRLSGLGEYIPTHYIPKVYISPKVFSNKDMISKAIIKHLVPQLAEYNIQILIEAPTQFIGVIPGGAATTGGNLLVQELSSDIVGFFLSNE